MTTFTHTNNVQGCGILIMDILPPANRILDPLRIPENRLLCGPGPSNPHPRVLKASSLPLLGHLHAEFLEVMSDITAGLQYLFQTSNSLTIAVSGSGHAGMEAAFVNVLEEGDRVLVLKNGTWGVRGREVAERCGKSGREIELLLELDMRVRGREVAERCGKSGREIELPLELDIRVRGREVAERYGKSGREIELP